MKPKVPNEEFRKFLKKLIIAYKSFDDARQFLNDLELEYEFDSFINSEQIDDCQTLIEKGLGWEILSTPERVNLNDKK